MRRNAHIQAAVEVLGVYLPPDPVPLSEGTAPLLILLLQPRQHDGYADAGVLVQSVDHFSAKLFTVDLLDDSLVDALALIAQAGFQAERHPLLRIHGGNPCGDGLEQRNGAKVGLNVEIVLVPLFLGAVEGLLKGVLLVCKEELLAAQVHHADPLVVQDLPA